MPTPYTRLFEKYEKLLAESHKLKELLNACLAAGISDSDLKQAVIEALKNEHKQVVPPAS
jgi:hypothetical protein